MRRDILAGKIANFCFDCGESETRKRIESKLDEVEFIELLISTVHTKARTAKNIDVALVKELLVELETIRVELEF